MVEQQDRWTADFYRRRRAVLGRLGDVPRDPHEAADALAAALGSRRAAWRWLLDVLDVFATWEGEERRGLG